MCFVSIWEQTASISLYSIDWLVCVTQTESVYCAVRIDLVVQFMEVFVFKKFIKHHAVTTISSNITQKTSLYPVKQQFRESNI